MRAFLRLMIPSISACFFESASPSSIHSRMVCSFSSSRAARSPCLSASRRSASHCLFNARTSRSAAATRSSAAALRAAAGLSRLRRRPEPLLEPRLEPRLELHIELHLSLIELRVRVARLREGFGSFDVIG